MNRIKNTLLTFASQLLLAGAVALLTQQVTHAQTNVNVVNTPTVRIDSRANEVKVVNSPSAPVPVKVLEEPLHLFLSHTADNVEGGCFLIPIPQGRWAVIEHIAAQAYLLQTTRITLGVSYRSHINGTAYVTPYEAPISDRKGQLQAKLYVRGVNYVDAAVGDFFDAQICFDNLNPNLKPTITTIVTGRLLPQ